MPYDFTIKKIGECKIKSPMPLSTTYGDSIANFVRDDEYVIRANVVDDELKLDTKDWKANFLEKAGPREHIYFNPSHVHAAICTCGGLCPGLNDVIRAIVRTLWYRYGVKRISGIRYGYQGFHAENGLPLKELNADNVDDIHYAGGSILGSGRGGCEDVPKVVDAMERMNLNILFIIGGDGTQRGALEISEEVEKRGLKISVVGIPKTIDNDLSFISRSFGFDTAVAKAVEAVHAAHTEAKSALNGIGLVKVMGRESGYIAAHTAMANNDVNFVLIPEVDFKLDGPNGFLKHLEERIRTRHHAVVLVAEGAGQDQIKGTGEVDAGGNKKLPGIGIFLRDRIREYFDSINLPMNLKYIDPSYIIRAQPATPNDSLYCARLGANIVHAAMSGRTGCLISEWNGALVHLPIQMAVSKRNTVNPEGAMWRDVLETTRQPIKMV